MINPQVIAAYPFLGKMSAGSRRLLEAQGKVRTLRRGTTVIRKGDRVGGMYFVISGDLRVFILSPGGEEASLYRVGPGESCLLATSAVFAEMLYPAWVEVDSREVKLYSIPAAIFRTLFSQERVVQDFIVKVLSERVFDLMSVVEELSLQSIEDRLKNLLARRASPNGEVVMTHEKIAFAMGTAREVVSRKLKQLTEAGLIETTRGRIYLLKPAALKTRKD